MNKRIIALMLSFTCLASPALAERYTTQVPVTLTFDGQTYTDTIEIQWEMDAPDTPEPESALQYGNSGDAVSKLQQDLKALGYFSGSVTGFFGSSTQKAVSALQKANGLAETGMADAQTLAKIEELLGQKNDSDNEEETPEEKYSSFGDMQGGFNLYVRKYPSDDAEILVCVNEYTPCRMISASFVDSALWWYVSFVYEGKPYHGYVQNVGYEGNDAMLYVAGGGILKDTDLSTAGYVKLLPETPPNSCRYHYGYWRDEDLSGGALTWNTDYIYEYVGIVDGWYRLRSGMWLKQGCTQEIDGSTLYTAENRLLYHYGDRNDELVAIKERLNAAYQLRLNTNSNVYDLALENAVRNVQKEYINYGEKLNITGAIDANTLHAILLYTASAIEGTTVTVDHSYARANKNNVYLYADHAETSDTKAVLSKGQKFRISKAYTINGVQWYEVTVGLGTYTYSGFIRADMAELISEAEYGDASVSGEPEIIGMIQITSYNVPLRAQPNTNAECKGFANAGDCFYYGNTVLGWFQTREGYWIDRNYAKVMTDAEVENYLKANGDDTITYAVGSTGSTVAYIQNALSALKYYDREISGHYGPYTAEAVQAFQRDHGLTADGVCNAATLIAIRRMYSGSSTAATTYNATIYNLDWFTIKGNGVLTTLGLVRNQTARLTDLTTEKSLNIHIQSTGNHLDVEPLTSADTTTLCEIYGVSSPSSINYKRRPMLITTSYGVQIVCSMYGEPHGAQDITNNNYDGQFCVHFLNSKTHGSNNVDSDHQNAIRNAISIVSNMTVDGAKVTVKTVYP